MKVCIPKLALRLSRPNQPSDQLGNQVQCRSQKLHKKTCQIFVRCAGFSTPAHLCPLLFCQSLQPPSIVLKFDASVRKRQKIQESTSLVWLPSMLHVNAVRATMVPAGLRSTLTYNSLGPSLHGQSFSATAKRPPPRCRCPRPP